MRLIQYLSIIVFILTTHLAAKESLVEIVYPEENSLHRETHLNVVLRIVPNSVDKIILITPKGLKKIKIIDSKLIYCKSITLNLGENRIKVRSYKDKKIVDEHESIVYVASEVYHEFKYPPKLYKKTFFHNDKNEAECSKCHKMDSNEIDGVAFIDVTESNCYECHKDITKDKFAHAPSVNWLCTSCHNGKTSVDNSNEKGLSKYIAPEPVNETCFKCHKDNYKKWNNLKYRHEPLDSGNCNKCHNPHSSPYSVFVRKPVNLICLGCHKDKYMRAKNLKKSNCSGTSEDKKCINCHTPHASNKAFFLKDKDIKDK